MEGGVLKGVLWRCYPYGGVLPAHVWDGLVVVAKDQVRRLERVGQGPGA